MEMKNKNAKKMWAIVGLEDSPKNDKNIYSSLEQAEMHAPTPSFLKKIQVVIIDGLEN